MSTKLTESAIEFIGLEFQRRVPIIFGPVLVFGFIFGSVAKGYAQAGHDLDVFICLEEHRPQGERLMLSWLADLHKRYDLTVDQEYPAEIVTRTEIEDAIDAAATVDLQLGLNDSETFDKVVWIQVLSDQKFAAVGDLEYLSKLEAASSPWPAAWTNRYYEKLRTAIPVTVLRKAVQFTQKPLTQPAMQAAVPEWARPSKSERLKQFYQQMQQLPPAANGLEAFQQICTVINAIEDEIWGLNEWHIPRSFNSGVATHRLYPPQPDNFETVPDYPGVTNMVLKREFIFVSRHGAIEIQRDDGSSESDNPYSQRRGCVVFAKPDRFGRGVWDDVETHELAPESSTGG